MTSSQLQGPYTGNKHYLSGTNAWIRNTGGGVAHPPPSGESPHQSQAEGVSKEYHCSGWSYNSDEWLYQFVVFTFDFVLALPADITLLPFKIYFQESKVHHLL